MVTTLWFCGERVFFCRGAGGAGARVRDRRKTEQGRGAGLGSLGGTKGGGSISRGTDRERVDREREEGRKGGEGAEVGGRGGGRGVALPKGKKTRRPPPLFVRSSFWRYVVARSWLAREGLGLCVCVWRRIKSIGDQEQGRGLRGERKKRRKEVAGGGADHQVSPPPPATRASAGPPPPTSCRYVQREPAPHDPLAAQ